jgi:hypothetical protein
MKAGGGFYMADKIVITVEGGIIQDITYNLGHPWGGSLPLSSTHCGDVITPPILVFYNCCIPFINPQPDKSMDASSLPSIILPVSAAI